MVTATSLSVLLVYQLAPFSLVMVEPALPPLPDRGRKPIDNPLAAEPPVPPAAAAEPVEVNEVFLQLFLVFCITCPTFFAGVLGRVAALSFICLR